MDSQEYDQLARETQAIRVSLMWPVLYERARRARDTARATRRVSADLRACAEEWATVPWGTLSIGSEPEVKTERVRKRMKVGLLLKR